MELVAQHGTKNWAYMETVFPHRSAKQCRERYRNQLDPNIKREPWSEEEDLAIIQAVETMGTRWVPIAKLLPGRTDNQIKNHWNSILSKRREETLRLKAKRDREETEDRSNRKRCKPTVVVAEPEHNHEAAQPLSPTQMELLDKLLPAQSHLSDGMTSSEELSSQEEEELVATWSASPDADSIHEEVQGSECWEDVGSEEMGLDGETAVCVLTGRAAHEPKPLAPDADVQSPCSVVGASLCHDMLNY